jgi:hypothetical protein
MSIECAFHGFVAADAEAKVSAAGKNWVRLRAGVGKDDEVQWVGIAVFGKAAEGAAALKKGDKIYVERTGLSVAAFKCERTHLIGRNRPRRDGDSRAKIASPGAVLEAEDARK